MSHFVVMVVGDDVEGQLAPFHEFECTGQDDQYVQEVDITQRAMDEYRGRTARVYVDPEGNRHDPHEDRFYREPTPEEEAERGPMLGSGSDGKGLSWYSKDWGDGKGHRPKVHQLPEGWQEVEVPTSEVESFAEFVEGWYGIRTVPHGGRPDVEDEHKYGYCLLDENGVVTKVIDRTNPNSRWDWWQLGGRWRGFFALKDKEQAVAVRLGEDIERSGDYAAILGQSGVFDNEPELDADSALKMDIDWDAMMAHGRRQAEEAWDKVHGAAGDLEGFEAWEVVRGRHEDDIDAARKEYRDQPVVKRLDAAVAADKAFPFFMSYDEVLAQSREEYTELGALGAITPYAYVKDGEWHERGEMGWWGMASNEKPPKLWEYQFKNMLDELPLATRLSIVDCHI